MNVIQAIKRAAWPATVVVALVAFNSSAYAQAKPTKAAMAAAEELVKITGATQLFNPLIPGVIEQAKILFLQQNPALAQDLNVIAAKIADRSGAALYRSDHRSGDTLCDPL